MVFNIKKQKLVTNSSSTTTLEYENEDLNIGLDIDITTQKSSNDENDMALNNVKKVLTKP
jgi:hypothetical protein